MTAPLLASAAMVGWVLLAGTGSRARLHAVLRPSAGALPWRRLRRTRQRGRTTAAALEVPFGLSLELRSGRDLAGALRAVGDELLESREVSDRLHRAATAAAEGRDVRPALTTGPTGAVDPLGVALRPTAACCDASTAAGLPLADVLDALAQSARSHGVLVGRAKAELAGASSTAVVLACLPLAGLAMGQLLGARPGHVLLGTPWGLGCLGLSMVLTAAGVGWSRLIARGLRKALP